MTKARGQITITDIQDGTTITSVSVTYATTTDNTQPSEFPYTSVPMVRRGTYLWSKTTVEYSDGKHTDTIACSRIGCDGDKGDSLHIAYSTEYPVTKESFSKVYKDGVKYVGIYSDADKDNLITTPSVLLADNGQLLFFSDNSDGEWNDPHYQWQKFVGEDGKLYFKSTAFIRQDDVPSTPSGGDFDSPIPTTEGWSDGIPSGNKRLWASTCIFSKDDKGSYSEGWTTPRQLTDTATFDICYSSTYGDTKKEPVNHGTQTDAADNGWHNDAREDDKWMATSICENGVWGKWQIVKIKGENGNDGTSALSFTTNYSFDQNNIDTYGKDGYIREYTVNEDTSVARVGDSASLRVTNSSKGKYAWIIGLITQIPSSRSLIVRTKGLLENGDTGAPAESYYVNPSALIVTERINFTDEDNSEQKDKKYTSKDYVYDIPSNFALYHSVGSVNTIIKAKSWSCTVGVQLLPSDWVTRLQDSFKASDGYKLSSILLPLNLKFYSDIYKVILTAHIDNNISIDVIVYINRLGTTQSQTYGDTTEVVRTKIVTEVVGDDIKAAQDAAKKANDEINNIVSDNILDPSEKSSIKKEFLSLWHEIIDTGGLYEKGHDNDGKFYSSAIEESYNNMLNAFNALGTYLNGGSDWSMLKGNSFASINEGNLPALIKSINLSTYTSIEADTYRANWNHYYSARAAYIGMLSKNAQDTADYFITNTFEAYKKETSSEFEQRYTRTQVDEKEKELKKSVSEIKQAADTISLRVTSQRSGRNMWINGDFEMNTDVAPKYIHNSDGTTAVSQNLDSVDLPAGFSKRLAFNVPKDSFGIFFPKGSQKYITPDNLNSNNSYCLSFFAKTTKNCDMRVGFDGISTGLLSLTAEWKRFAVYIPKGLDYSKWNGTIIFYPTVIGADNYVCITGIQFEVGTEENGAPTVWSKSTYDIKMTTGIDIENGLINAIAGLFNFVGNDGKPYIKVTNADGYPHLIFLDPSNLDTDGEPQPAYDLSYSGLNMLIAMHDRYFESMPYQGTFKPKDEVRAENFYTSPPQQQTIYEYVAQWYKNAKGNVVYIPAKSEQYNGLLYKTNKYDDSGTIPLTAENATPDYIDDGWHLEYINTEYKRGELYAQWTKGTGKDATIQSAYTHLTIVSYNLFYTENGKRFKTQHLLRVTYVTIEDYPSSALIVKTEDDYTYSFTLDNGDKTEVLTFPDAPTE